MLVVPISLITFVGDMVEDIHVQDELGVVPSPSACETLLPT